MIYRNSLLRILLLFFIIVSSKNNSLAQQNDSTQIAKAIDNYIVGWRTGDTDMLNKAFDRDAGLVLWVDKSGENEKLKSMKFSELLNDRKTNEGYGINYEVQSLNIIDSQIAIALVKIPKRDNHYIDCLELQKINGDWKIVLKSFVYFKE
ncbi:MAG: nuclear transport factor 2 family protein [Cyclobacteriaceae bacterium]